MSFEVAPLLARIPPPVWTAVYLAVAFVIDAILPTLRFKFMDHPLLGGIIAFAALAIAAYAAWTFFKAGTQIAPASHVNNRLVDWGPYRYTRNPLYLSLILLSVGIAFRCGSLPFFIVPVVVYLTNDRVVVPYEEHKMEAQYGDIYRSYMSRVRRWI